MQHRMSYDGYRCKGDLAIPCMLSRVAYLQFYALAHI